MSKTDPLTKRLQRQCGKAVADFSLIEQDDHLMVCLSGGKDSYTLLDMLLHFQRVAPVNFSLVAVNLDQKQPGFPEHVLPEYLSSKGVDYRIIEEDTFSIVKEKVPEGSTTCGLCSRLRRGILYRVADELGASKIALGHHADDLLETLLLNLFHGGSLKTMPPKLHADNGRNIVIRPMAYCRERDIADYSLQKQFPIIPCNLCGSQPNLQRQNMKQLLAQWEEQDPSRIASMLNALGKVTPSHLLDRTLFDFDNNTRIGASTSTESTPNDDHPGIPTRVNAEQATRETVTRTERETIRDESVGKVSIKQPNVPSYGSLADIPVVVSDELR